MSKVRGKLKRDDEYRLRANYSYLAKEIDAQYLVSELYSKFVLDEDDKEKILSKASAKERNQLLLDILLHSGPGEAYNKFVEVLTEVYPEAAGKLKEQTLVQEDPQPSYPWYDELPTEVKACMITEADASRISVTIGNGWQHVMARLGVTNVEIQQQLYNHPHASNSEVITKLLIRWKQRNYRQATVDKLVSVLKEVDEGGICTVDWELVEKALRKNVT